MVCSSGLNAIKPRALLRLRVARPLFASSTCLALKTEARLARLKPLDIGSRIKLRRPFLLLCVLCFYPSNGLHPTRDGPTSDGLHPSSDGFQPNSDGLQLEDWKQNPCIPGSDNLFCLSPLICANLLTAYCETVSKSWI